MIIAILGVSLLLTVIGFIVTENTAKYLLAGYNTMTKEERGKFDLKSYLRKFKRFHIFLGISLLAVGITLALVINENAAGIFLAIYPIVAYPYFFWSTTKNS